MCELNLIQSLINVSEQSFYAQLCRIAQFVDVVIVVGRMSGDRLITGQGDDDLGTQRKSKSICDLHKICKQINRGIAR